MGGRLPCVATGAAPDARRGSDSAIGRGVAPVRAPPRHGRSREQLGRRVAFDQRRQDAVVRSAGQALPHSSMQEPT